ncbi:hypothetical protein MIMGU_mgv1a017228mg [Erythranthe guttata]|uniref:Uncharacterized protein n=1 Tax=Erythranthe guttata TaxID=4155 RepID=A0A022RZL9_ERYGU|nr:hypothetical protein MIMGU_mgv1a017228mg [Erythranthe guttata]
MARRFGPALPSVCGSVFLFAFLLSLTSTRGTRLSTQQLDKYIWFLLGLVTTIILANSKPIAIAKHHHKSSKIRPAGVFIHLSSTINQ